MRIVGPLLATLGTCLVGIISLGWLVLCVAGMPNSQVDTVSWMIAFGPLVVSGVLGVLSLGMWVSAFSPRRGYVRGKA